jgi:hypothetical protein
MMNFVGVNVVLKIIGKLCAMIYGNVMILNNLKMMRDLEPLGEGERLNSVDVVEGV